MTVNEPCARAPPGGTSCGIGLPSVLMSNMGSFEVKLVAVLSRKTKFRATTALGNRLVAAGGKIRALMVMFAFNVSGPV